MKLLEQSGSGCVSVPLWFSCDQAHKVAVARDAAWVLLHDGGNVHVIAKNRIESLLEAYRHRCVLIAA